MKIDVNKDITLISHPRSGSYWLQSCFPHYNCREGLNVHIVYSPEDRFNEVQSNFTPINATLMEQALTARINLIDSIKQPKCVKIHTSYINSRILDWINSQDSKIVWLTRRDKLAAFRSLLIADVTHRYWGTHDRKTIKVDLSRVLKIYSILFDESRDEFIKRNLNREIEYVCYEDLLSDPTFVETFMIKQDSNNVVIENWQCVIDYLNHHNLLMESWINY